MRSLQHENTNGKTCTTYILNALWLWSSACENDCKLSAQSRVEYSIISLLWLGSAATQQTIIFTSITLQTNTKHMCMHILYVVMLSTCSQCCYPEKAGADKTIKTTFACVFRFVYSNAEGNRSRFSFTIGYKCTPVRLSEIRATFRALGFSHIVHDNIIFVWLCCASLHMRWRAYTERSFTDFGGCWCGCCCGMQRTCFRVGPSEQIGLADLMVSTHVRIDCS